MCEMKVFVDIVNIILVGWWPGPGWYKHNDRENDNLYEATPVAGEATFNILSGFSHLSFCS